MTIVESIFADYEVHRQPIEGCPEPWSRLLSVNSSGATGEICDHIGLKPHSKVRTLITIAADVALLIPRRKRERNKIRNWRLALQLSEDSVMLIWPPSDRGVTGDYPDEYI